MLQDKELHLRNLAVRWLMACPGNSEGPKLAQVPWTALSWGYWEVINPDTLVARVPRVESVKERSNSFLLAQGLPPPGLARKLFPMA